MKKNRQHNMKKMYIDFIEKKICKNNAVYIFSYFFFVFMNVIGTIILIDWLNYQPPILYMVFTSFFIFIFGIISRCICVKCDKTNDDFSKLLDNITP